MLQLIVAIALALLLIGYAAGRRLGMAEGRHVGEQEAIIRLRDDAYIKGVCPLCGATAKRAATRRPEVQ